MYFEINHKNIRINRSATNNFLSKIGFVSSVLFALINSLLWWFYFEILEKRMIEKHREKKVTVHVLRWTHIWNNHTRRHFLQIFWLNFKQFLSKPTFSHFVSNKFVKYSVFNRIFVKKLPFWRVFLCFNIKIYEKPEYHTAIAQRTIWELMSLDLLRW